MNKHQPQLLGAWSWRTELSSPKGRRRTAHQPEGKDILESPSPPFPRFSPGTLCPHDSVLGKETICRAATGMAVRADQDESLPSVCVLATQGVAHRGKEPAPLLLTSPLTPGPGAPSPKPRTPHPRPQGALTQTPDPV